MLDEKPYINLNHSKSIYKSANFEKIDETTGKGKFTIKNTW